MKLLPGIVFAFATFASCAALAVQTPERDQERRERNREDALVRYHTMHDRDDDRDASSRHESLREETHEGAQSMRSFTHRQAEKARHSSEEVNRHYHMHTTPNMNLDGGSAGGK